MGLLGIDSGPRGIELPLLLASLQTRTDFFSLKSKTAHVSVLIFPSLAVDAVSQPYLFDLEETSILHKG